MFSIGKRTDTHVTEMLSAYLDNELNPRERAVVDAHLRTCSACAADLRSLQATVQTLQTLPTVAVPRSFILQPAFQPRCSTPLQLTVLRLATAVTTAALVLGLASQVLLRGYQPAMAPAPTVVAATGGTSGLRESAPAAQPTKAAAASAPVPAAAPTAAESTSTVAGAAITATDHVMLAAPKAADTPVANAAAPAPMAASAPVSSTAVPAPAAPAVPTAAASADERSAAAPAATVPPPAVQKVAPSSTALAPTPAPTASPIPVPSAMPAPAPAANASTPPLRAIQVGLAGLLAVLVVALVAANRKQK